MPTLDAIFQTAVEKHLDDRFPDSKRPSLSCGMSHWDSAYDLPELVANFAGRPFDWRLGWDRKSS